MDFTKNNRYSIKIVDIAIFIVLIILIVVITRKKEGAKVIKGTNQISQKGMMNINSRKVIVKDIPSNKNFNYPGIQLKGIAGRLFV